MHVLMQVLGKALGFLRVLATTLSCPKDPNCFLTGFTISSLVFLLSIYNTAASGVLLKSYHIYSSPQTLCGLQVYAKEEPKSSPHPPKRLCMFCLSLTLFIFWPYYPIIFSSFSLGFSYTGLLVMPQTYLMCSWPRAFCLESSRIA